MDDRFLATIESLALAVDGKDEVTHAHVRRVQRHTRAVADALGVTDPLELKALDAASLLHDVGKITVPDRILHKPGRLTAEEFAEMKLHVESGVRILDRVRFPYPVVPIVRHHHETWDGTGYPDGLSGASIPLGARILSVVDVFDALTSDRPYRRRLTDADALAMLTAGRAKQFDPEVIDQFEALIPALRRVDDLEAARPAEHRSPDAAAVHVERFVPWADQRLTTVLWKNAPGALRRLREQMPQAEAIVFAADADGGDMVAVHTTPVVRDAASRVSGAAHELSTWVMKHRHTIENADAVLDLNDEAAALGLRRMISIPVFGYARVIGVLSVYLHRDEPLTDGQVSTLGVLAQQLAVPDAPDGAANALSDEPRDIPSHA